MDFNELFDYCKLLVNDKFDEKAVKYYDFLDYDDSDEDDIVTGLYRNDPNDVVIVTKEKPTIVTSESNKLLKDMCASDDHIENLQVMTKEHCEQFAFTRHFKTISLFCR